MLLSLGTTFYSFPNELITGFIFVVSMTLGTLLVRSLYILMHRKHHYPDDQVYLLVLGAKTIKVLAVFMLIALGLLGFRVKHGIEAGQFWQLDSVSRGWWCIIRLVIGVLAALCASVFETHFLFRMWASLTVPLAAVLDLLSQAQFAMHISCIDHGLCQPDPSKERELYALAWRDIVSAILALMFFGVSTWLWFMFGLFGQDVSMPRAEHRAMAARLDKVKLKPKELRRGAGAMGAAGRQHLADGAANEDSQLEKMLGYN